MYLVQLGKLQRGVSELCAAFSDQLAYQRALDGQEEEVIEHRDDQDGDEVADNVDNAVLGQHEAHIDNFCADYHDHLQETNPECGMPRGKLPWVINGVFHHVKGLAQRVQQGDVQKDGAEEATYHDSHILRRIIIGLCQVATIDLKPDEQEKENLADVQESSLV